MVNLRELPINLVNMNKPNDAVRLEPKGEQVVTGSVVCP